MRLFFTDSTAYIQNTSFAFSLYLGKDLSSVFTTSIYPIFLIPGNSQNTAAHTLYGPKMLRLKCQRILHCKENYRNVTEPSPVDSIREVVFTVSPNRQYLGIACPTTPVNEAHVIPQLWLLRICPILSNTNTMKSVVLLPNINITVYIPVTVSANQLINHLRFK